MDIFELAERQLQKEKRLHLRNDYTLLNIVDYAVKIRKYFDYKERGEAISQAKRRV